MKPDNPMYLRIISYCVIFIPTVLAFASFPLNIHPMVNNIYTVFMGHDTSNLRVLETYGIGYFY